MQGVWECPYSPPLFNTAPMNDVKIQSTCINCDTAKLIYRAIKYRRMSTNVYYTTSYCYFLLYFNYICVLSFKAVFKSFESCRMVGDVTHCYFEMDNTFFSPVEAPYICPGGTHVTTITSQEELEFVFLLKCKQNALCCFYFFNDVQARTQGGRVFLIFSTKNSDSLLKYPPSFLTAKKVLKRAYSLCIYFL